MKACLIIAKGECKEYLESLYNEKLKM
jgi:hypothetical protein